MIRNRLAGLGLLAAALALAVPRPAAADAGARPSYTINVARFSVSSIGSFRPSRDPSVEAAERAFGPASSRRDTSSSSCEVRWRRPGLRIVFASFDSRAPGQTTCSPGVGRAQSFVVRGRRFRTWHGLRVGQRERSVQRRHPGAERHGSGWWITSAISPFGDGVTPYAVLAARIGPSRRVRALRGWIGSAGE